MAGNSLGTQTARPLNFSKYEYHIRIDRCMGTVIDVLFT
jgi:hypothetical protein